MFGARRRKLATKVALTAAVVGATGAWSVPMAVADGGRRRAAVAVTWCRALVPRGLTT